MFKKDIGKVVNKLYDKYYSFSADDDDSFLSEGASYRAGYYKMLFDANLCAMVKISHLMDNKNHTNSGFTYARCSSITMHCVNIIKWAQEHENLTKRDQKRFELAKKVLPYLYKNMKADYYSTMDAYAERKKELEELKLDTSMLDNFKNQIVKKQEEKNI